MGHVKVDTLSRTGVSDKTLHPSIFCLERYSFNTFRTFMELKLEEETV